MTASLGSGLADDGLGTDTMVSIENLGGSPGADDLIGNNGNNVLDGKGGDDYLFGLGGNDILTGRNGNDFIPSRCCTAAETNRLPLRRERWSY